MKKFVCWFVDGNTSRSSGELRGSSAAHQAWPNPDGAKTEFPHAPGGTGTPGNSEEEQVPPAAQRGTSSRSPANGS